MERNIALILAAGSGTRMGLGYNKQLLKLGGETVIERTLSKFQNSKLIDEIVLVISQVDEKSIRLILEGNKFSKIKSIVFGGKERSDSVLNGLRAIKDCNIVLIHDGARPFVSEKLISDGIEYAKQFISTAPGVKLKDTIKTIDKNGFVVETLNRDELISIQTPQCFKYQSILEAHNRALKNNIPMTDDTKAMELIGVRTYIYDGEYNNIKITTMDDINIADKILENSLN